MISVILYGRNDTYGYNLHKRAAISLNCIAEVLDEADDEIIFVDYNTPDDFPTFPEAIQDTLSAKTRQRLRILRVRPHIHARFSARTHLKALEPISRNVAVRRSNPMNRWILSTNTDMIFVPRQRKSLSAIARGLPAGAYGAPRLELPETLWESLDRSNGPQIVDRVRGWGRDLHLDEVVYSETTILYDGPGDFQLLQRADLFAIDGFDESMLLGWHVDANICKRLSLVHGGIGDLGGEVFGYHCDHTRQITPAHQHNRRSNDLSTYYYGLFNPFRPDQRSRWGCPDDAIEEIRLATSPADAYVRALRQVLGGPVDTPYVVRLKDSYNKVSYEAAHVLPFLLDNFFSLPRTCNVGWFGLGPELLRLFALGWSKLGFIGTIFVSEEDVAAGLVAGSGTTVVSRDALLESADAFVFDIGGAVADVHERVPAEAMQHFVRAFSQTVAAERRRLAEGADLRRIFAVNAIYNGFANFFSSYVGAGETPFSSRIRHGFILPPQDDADLLPLMQPIRLGYRCGTDICSTGRMPGYFVEGPYKHVPGGDYQLRIKLDVDPGQPRSGGYDVMCEAALGDRTFAVKGLKLAAGQDELILILRIHAEATESLDLLMLRVRTLAPLTIRMTGLHLARLRTPPSYGGATREGFVVSYEDGVDWLSVLQASGIGYRDGTDIRCTGHDTGYFAEGPHEPLPGGDYRLRITMGLEGVDASPNGYDVICEAALGDRALGARRLKLTSLQDEHVLVLRVPPAAGGKAELFDLRIRTLVPLAVRLTALHVCREPAEVPYGGGVRSGFVVPYEKGVDWLPLMEVPSVGYRAGTDVCSAGQVPGYFADGPHEPLPGGDYELRIVLGTEGDPRPGGYDVVCEAVLGETMLGTQGLKLTPLQDEYRLILRVPFDATSSFAPFALRLRTLAPLKVRLTRLQVFRLPVPPRHRGGVEGGFVVPYDEGVDWLPGMEVPGIGYRRGPDICCTGVEPGYFVDGPHEVLPSGDYRFDVTMGVDDGADRGTVGSDVVCEAVIGSVILATKTVKLTPRQEAHRFGVHVPEHGKNGGERFNLRLRTTAPLAVRLTRLRVSSPARD